MAAATTIAAAGVGLATSGAQLFSGMKQKKEAQKALENYDRQEFNNVADDLSVYTKGAEMQTQESARLGSSSVDALSRSGTRGIIGGIGRLQQSQNLQQQQIAANLEQQQARIDQIRAQDEARIRRLQENREINDIAALSTQYQQGQNMMMSGISGLASTATNTMGAMGEQANYDNYMNQMYSRPEVQSAGAGLESQGYQNSPITGQLMGNVGQ